MSQTQNYYVVAIGRNPGIYSTWNETQSQIKDYHGAKYKKFTNKSSAENWYTINKVQDFGKSDLSILTSNGVDSDNVVGLNITNTYEEKIKKYQILSISRLGIFHSSEEERRKACISFGIDVNDSDINVEEWKIKT